MRAFPSWRTSARNYSSACGQNLNVVPAARQARAGTPEPRAWPAGGAGVAQELVDLAAEVLRLLAELDCGIDHLGGGGAGRLHALAHAAGIGGYVRGSARLLGRGGDLLRLRALAFHRAGDEGRDFPHLVDGRPDALDGVDALAGR